MNEYLLYQNIIALFGQTPSPEGTRVFCHTRNHDGTLSTHNGFAVQYTDQQCVVTENCEDWPELITRQGEQAILDTWHWIAQRLLPVDEPNPFPWINDPHGRYAFLTEKGWKRAGDQSLVCNRLRQAAIELALPYLAIASEDFDVIDLRLHCACISMQLAA